MILGIESTAHTASVGIVDEEGKYPRTRLFHVSPPKGGTTPAKRRITMSISPGPSAEALESAHVRPREVDGVAFAQGPGLGPCLRAGATVARTLALTWNRPFVPVNHCVAHIEIARRLSGLDDPLLLYASGGNTQVVAYGSGRYRVLGETLDIGIGNFLDQLWIHLGGQFPGGLAIEAEARLGSELLPLPYSVHGMDVAFSGMYTASLALDRNGARRPDLLYSVESTAYSMLTEITERALAHLGRLGGRRRRRGVQ